MVLSVSYNDELNILASGSKSGVLLLHSFDDAAVQQCIDTNPSHSCHSSVIIHEDDVASALAVDNDKDTDIVMEDTDTVNHQSSPLTLSVSMLCE